MSEHQCQGIILKLTERGEADQLVWMMTDLHGRQTFRARAAKKSKKRFAGLLQLFSLHDVTFQTSRQSWPVIKHIEGISIPTSFRHDLEGFAAASYGSELFLRLTRENDPQPELFLLLKSYIQFCQDQPLTPKALCRFHLRLLQELGLQPDWQHCMECGREAHEDLSFRFSTSEGGLLCPFCFPHPREDTPQLGDLTRQLMIALQYRLQPPTDSPLLWRAATDLLDKRIAQLIGNPPKSRAFLREMLEF